MRQRDRTRTGGPVLMSLALHGVLAAAMAVFAGGEAPKPPKVKVYAVDIVSPPPNVEGEPVPEAMANQEPGPAAAAEPAAPASEPAAPEPSAPEPAPKAAPPTPAPTPPKPAPTPPRPAPIPEKAPPREPQKAPEPRRTPERAPERPAEKNADRPAEKNRTPSTTPRTPATTTPARPGGQTTTRPTTPATNRGGTSTQPGSGTDANRSTGDGRRTGPATGRNADANSAGGEGLTLRSGGVRCPTAGYCDNIVRQVRRYFRAPEGAAGGSGNVCFRILRDGSVAQITTERVRGGAAFRLALMEAAEQAGSRRAFGGLPAAFGTDELPVCVDISPSTAG